jgi:hypothetical protein
MMSVAARPASGLPSCARCGAPALQDHHLTGRPLGGGAYFDPILTTPLCARCHALVHQVMRLIGLAGPIRDLPPTTAPFAGALRKSDPATLRLLRAAVMLKLLGERDRPLPAESCRPLGVMLVDVAATLPAAAATPEGRP